MNKSAVFLLVFSVLFLSSSVARAITIDEFDGTQIVTAAGPGNISSGTIASASAIGGFRGIYTQVTVGLVLRSEVAGGLYTHSHSAITSGYSIVSWDGDNNPGLPLSYSGLGGVDITKDGATAVILGVNSFDFANAKPIDLILTFFDSRDPDGGTSSTARITLPDKVNSLTNVEIKFSDFAIAGVDGPADLRSVGAIQLQIIGINNPEADLSFLNIATNGRCGHAPVGGRVIDECGVCNGDNSTCSDCNGIPNGAAKPGSGCDTGKLGACGVGVYSGKFPACTCVQQQPQPVAETCDLVDNNCDGTIDEKLADRCGVCGGDGTTCLECVGINQSELLFKLDGTAAEQRAAVLAGVRILRRATLPNVDLDFERMVLEKSGVLYLKNWTISWQLPRVSTQCLNATYCVSASNMPTVEEYRKHALQLRDLGLAVIERVKVAQNGIKSRGERRVSLLVNKAYRKGLLLTDSVPITQSVCTNDARLSGITF